MTSHLDITEKLSTGTSRINKTLCPKPFVCIPVLFSSGNLFIIVFQLKKNLRLRAVIVFEISLLEVFDVKIFAKGINSNAKGDYEKNIEIFTR